MKQNQKGFGLIEILLITAVVVSLVFISIVIYQRHQKTLTINDVCSIINDASFSSVEKNSAPLSSSGTKTNSYLKFHNGTASWYVDDMVMPAQYNCTNNQISIQFHDSQKKGEFIPSIQMLNFDGNKYKLESK